jgi:hypothetical protein
MEHIRKEYSKDEFAPVLNYLSTTTCKRMGEWNYSSVIIELGSTWRRVVNFTPLSLYTRGNSLGILCIDGWVGP